MTLIEYFWQIKKLIFDFFFLKKNNYSDQQVDFQKFWLLKKKSFPLFLEPYKKKISSINPNPHQPATTIAKPCHHIQLSKTPNPFHLISLYHLLPWVQFRGAAFLLLFSELLFKFWKSTHQLPPPMAEAAVMGANIFPTASLPNVTTAAHHHHPHRSFVLSLNKPSPTSYPSLNLRCPSSSSISCNHSFHGGGIRVIFFGGEGRYPNQTSLPSRPSTSISVSAQVSPLFSLSPSVFF